MIILTDEERKKFVAWLKQEITSDKLLLEGMEKIKAPEALKRMRTAAIAAKAYLVREIELTELQTIEAKIEPQFYKFCKDCGAETLHEQFEAKGKVMSECKACGKVEE